MHACLSFMRISRASSSSTSSHPRPRQQQQGEALRHAFTAVEPQRGSDTEVEGKSPSQGSSGGTSTSSGRLKEQLRMMEQVKHNA